MNLLYALTAYPPSTGGAQAHFHELARCLKTRHKLRVVCHWKENRTDWLRGVTVDAPGDSAYTLDGIRVQQLNLGTEDRRRLAFWAWGYYAFMGASVRKISQALFEKMDLTLGPVDLVHAGRIGREFLAWGALRLARKRGVPFVLTPFHHPRWSGFRWRWYMRLYREADAVIALTRAEKDTLAGLGVAQEKIHVLGHAPVVPDTIKVKNFFGPGGPVVLFLGQKYEYKGLEQLLQSMPTVWEKMPEVRFAFIGPRTPYSQRVFAPIKDTRVLEIDRVNEAEKWGALADCAVFCLPSRQESFGAVFTEAWSQGKPVVGGNIPAVAELIANQKDGLLVGTSPQELAQALLSLLQNPKRAQTLGRAGKAKVAKEFSWKTLSAKLEKIYKSVIASHSKRG